MVDSVATWNGKEKTIMDETHGGGKIPKRQSIEGGPNPTNFGLYP
jgi:hypothetical protein